MQAAVLCEFCSIQGYYFISHVSINFFSFTWLVILCVLLQDKRELKGKKQKKIKDDEEKKNNSKENKAADYIHVRARRGQATDSHSLAERVY